MSKFKECATKSASDCNTLGMQCTFPVGHDSPHSWQLTLYCFASYEGTQCSFYKDHKGFHSWESRKNNVGSVEEVMEVKAWNKLEVIEVKKSKETVNHPEHYGGDSIYETIKVIEAWQLGFCDGNAVKYISRAKHKGTELEDLKKARWYLDRLISQLEKKNEDSRMEQGKTS